MTEQKKYWTILSILKTTTEFFSQKRIENPRLNAELLLAKILGQKRVQLYLSFEQILTPEEITAYREIVRRRANREPLHYILEETEFMGLPFRLTPDVLIPRPETELLVEEALKTTGSKKSGKTVMWEIGTGSGCISVSLAGLQPELKIFATDISESALKVAQINSQINNTTEKIEFIRHDIFENVPEQLKQAEIIISNPPYISREEMPALDEEIREYEPEIALSDFADGLNFYRRIMSVGKELKLCRYILLELSAVNSAKIFNLAEQYHFENIEIVNDLNKLPRVMKIKV